MEFISYTVIIHRKPRKGYRSAANLMVSCHIINYFSVWHKKEKEKVKKGVTFTVDGNYPPNLAYLVQSNETN